MIHQECPLGCMTQTQHTNRTCLHTCAVSATPRLAIGMVEDVTRACMYVLSGVVDGWAGDGGKMGAGIAQVPSLRGSGGGAMPTL